MTQNTQGQVDVHVALAALGTALEALLPDPGADPGAVPGEGPWDLATPAPGWTVAHQIAHLAWTDEVSLLATGGAEAFAPVLDQAYADPFGFVDAEREKYLADCGGGTTELLGRWRTSRARLGEALAAADPGNPLPWFGPPMRPRSMAAARVMETWAHGMDVADALGRTADFAAGPAFADALPHVARLGYRTRGFAYQMNGREAPDVEVRVELTAPDGTPVDFGPEDAGQRITGSLLDFCLLVTQRVHRDDTDLAAGGAEAEEWLGLAQCFAGLPGAGREPGTRTPTHTTTTPTGDPR